MSSLVVIKRKDDFCKDFPQARKRSRSGIYTGPEMMELDTRPSEAVMYSLNVSMMFEKYNFVFQLLKCPKEATAKIHDDKITIFGDQFFYQTITEVSERMDPVLYHLLTKMIFDLGAEVKYYF